MAKTWLVKTVRDDQIEETLNEWQRGEGVLTFHGVYPTGETPQPGPGGFNERRPTFVVVALREVRQVQTA